MRRHHYLYLRNTYLTEPEVLARLDEIHRDFAAAQAGEVGVVDPDGGGSWTHPARSRLLYGDGKVLTSLFRARPGDTRLDNDTGELVPVRAEADADLHFEGTGDFAWGTKWVIMAARGEHLRHRGLEDTLYLRRAHSLGRARQHVNLIGWALMVNSLTRAEHRARPPDQLAA